MDKLIDILNKGIEEKRNFNYKKALKYYSKAQRIDPYDSRSYSNCFKILIGTGQYEQAFRNLLVLCHFNILLNPIKHDSSLQNIYRQFLNRFCWNSYELSKNYAFEPNLIHNGIELNPELKDLIVRADNLTFYMGHCFIGEMQEKDNTILEKFGNSQNYFENLNKKTLGIANEPDFRNTFKEGYFLCIGFIYAHMNLNFSIETKKDIINYYLNPNIKIKKNIWEYRTFLRYSLKDDKDIINNKNEIEIDDDIEYRVVQKLTNDIENEFNTKVFKFGVIKKNSPSFIEFSPIENSVPDGAGLLFIFLLPIDENNNIITNQYYEKLNQFQRTSIFDPLSAPYKMQFQSILITVDQVRLFIQNKFGYKVYDNGIMNYEDYSINDNIVQNAEKINNLKYRYFRIFTPSIR